MVVKILISVLFAVWMLMNCVLAAYAGSDESLNDQSRVLGIIFAIVNLLAVLIGLHMIWTLM